MKYDRDETFLREKLTAGLHPTAVDVWPAVAEQLPAAHKMRRIRWLRLAVCVAAPLLIAAGVLVGTAEFTNLRENPRPSFAPQANTGYAITYERQYFTLDSDLLAGMIANHNGETAADGTKPGSINLSGRLHPDSADGRNLYAKAARGYDSWAELTAATGLPLVQNPLLDAGEDDEAVSVKRYITEWSESAAGDSAEFVATDTVYAAAVIPIGRGAVPGKVYLRMGKQIDGYRVEMMAVAYLGDNSKETAAAVFEKDRAGLTWTCESYPMANGNTALIPHCTSNPTSLPWVQSAAYFEQDGILYKVQCLPSGDVWARTQEEILVELRTVLDGFT